MVLAMHILFGGYSYKLGATKQNNLLNDRSAFYRYTKAFDREPIFVDLEVHFVEIFLPIFLPVFVRIC